MDTTALTTNRRGGVPILPSRSCKQSCNICSLRLHSLSTILQKSSYNNVPGFKKKSFSRIWNAVLFPRICQGSLKDPSTWPVICPDHLVTFGRLWRVDHDCIQDPPLRHFTILITSWNPPTTNTHTKKRNGTRQEEEKSKQQQQQQQQYKKKR